MMIIENLTMFEKYIFELIPDWLINKDLYKKLTQNLSKTIFNKASIIKAQYKSFTENDVLYFLIDNFQYELYFNAENESYEILYMSSNKNGKIILGYSTDIKFIQSLF